MVTTNDKWFNRKDGEQVFPSLANAVRRSFRADLQTAASQRWSFSPLPKHRSPDELVARVCQGGRSDPRRAGALARSRVITLGTGADEKPGAHGALALDLDHPRGSNTKLSSSSL